MFHDPERRPMEKWRKGRKRNERVLQMEDEEEEEGQNDWSETSGP